MGQFMGYFEYNENKVSTLMAWLYAGGVVLMTGCYCITHHQFFFGSQIVGMRLRVAAGSLIYRKVILFKKSIRLTFIDLLLHLSLNNIPIYTHFIGLKIESRFCRKMYKWKNRKPAS